MTRSRIEKGCAVALSASAARTGPAASARTSAANIGFMGVPLGCARASLPSPRKGGTRAGTVWHILPSISAATSGGHMQGTRMPDATPTAELSGRRIRMHAWQRHAILALIAIAALAIRLYYVRTAVVD